MWAPLLHGVVRGLFRRQQYRGMIAGKCAVFFARAVLFLLRLPGPHPTVQEYVGVGVQGPAYLGFRPADGLFVEFERWAVECRIASVERSLTRFLSPWRSVRCSVTEVHPCRED